MTEKTPDELAAIVRLAVQASADTQQPARIPAGDLIQIADLLSKPRARIPEAVGTQQFADEPLDTSRPPIPETVKHADFLAAVQPLCDLLNVTPYEVYSDLHILGGDPRSDSLARISFNVVAPEATIPSTNRYVEFSEVSVHVVTRVI